MKMIAPTVNGKEPSSAGGDEVVEPATGQVIAEYLCCDAEYVEQAGVSFSQWQNTILSDLGVLALKLTDLVEAISEKLIDFE